MMIKTSELIGAALDWAVAKCEGKNTTLMRNDDGSLFPNPVWEAGLWQQSHSTNWAQGGPIIERERINVLRGNDLYFPKGNEKGDHYEELWLASKDSSRNIHGQTPLIAAMRCLIASKLGDEVDIPEGLL
jgi:hypothetical protein